MPKEILYTIFYLLQGPSRYVNKKPASSKRFSPIYFFVVLVPLLLTPTVYGESLLCRLTLKAMLKSTLDNSNRTPDESGTLTLVDQFRDLINQSARTGTNDFFRQFGRTIKFDGPYLDPGLIMAPPVLVMMEQNPTWSLDSDILRMIRERRSQRPPKQFSSLRFEEARDLSMERLYQSYSQMGPEIRDHIESYLQQDLGTFATHLIFALPISPEDQRNYTPTDEFDQHFPPTHEFIGRAQGIGSYSPKHLLNVERDFSSKLQLNRQEGELWVELGRAMMETKSDVSVYAQSLIQKTGGWTSLQRSVFLKQILWLNHDVQPHAVVIHANAGTTRYLQRLTRLGSTLRIKASTTDLGSTENVIQISKQELLTIQRTLFLEELIDQVETALNLQKQNAKFRKSNFSSILHAPENAAFKDLGIHHFFEDPNSFWKVTFTRTIMGSEYWDLKGAAHYKVSSTNLKEFLAFLKARQQALSELQNQK